MFNTGCLLYHQGDTIVLIKTNIKIVEPRSERPSEGFVTFKVDCHCCCDNFESNKKLSIEISKLLQTIVVGSHALDLESLCIVSGKYVWSLQIDSIVVVDDGNVLDAILNGNVLALMDMRKPYIAVSQVKVIEKNTQIEMNNEKLQYLSLAHIPVSMSFGLIP